ncbi:MAG: DUF3990 domain-containing protein [Prevotellaceae bacterium]|jgi:hypothetical protein|nr:DUF3990 domain-containing protein [Prevotellaceae bacterium]
MKVYHGSYTAIHEIDLTKCEPKRDFGRGFYVTKLREQAEIFAVRKGNRKHTESVITEFEFDEDVYENDDFKILVFSDYNSEWFDFVIQNRKLRKIAHGYDIVEGLVADDKIQTRIQSFLDGVITKEEFFNQLKYPKPSHQICFCTVNSLKALKKTDYKIIYKVDSINEPIIEQLVHDCRIDETKAADLFFSSAIFGKLADIETKFYLKDWKEIYKMLTKGLNLSQNAQGT